MIYIDAISAIEKIASVAKKTKNIELYQEALNDAISIALKLQEENSKLKEEIKQFKDTKAQESDVKMKYKHPIVTRACEDHKVPYCGSCWGSNKNFIRVGVAAHTPRGPLYTCGQCQNKFIARSEKDVFEEA